MNETGRKALSGRTKLMGRIDQLSFGWCMFKKMLEQVAAEKRKRILLGVVLTLGATGIFFPSSLRRASSVRRLSSELANESVRAEAFVNSVNSNSEPVDGGYRDASAWVDSRLQLIAWIRDREPDFDITVRAQMIAYLNAGVAAGQARIAYYHRKSESQAAIESQLKAPEIRYSPNPFLTEGKSNEKNNSADAAIAEEKLALERYQLLLRDLCKQEQALVRIAADAGLTFEPTINKLISKAAATGAGESRRRSGE